MIKGLKRPTMRGMLCWLLAALCAGVFAACSQTAGMGIPSASDSQTASPGEANSAPAEATPVADDPEDAALAYAQCMRENGVPDFPDPDAEGRIMLRVGPDSDRSLNPDSPEFKQAADTCRHLQPAGRAGANGSPGDEEAALAFAHCMRENGVPDYPDPDPNAGPGIRITFGPDSKLDPNDPKVQSALETCDAILKGKALK